MAALAFDTLKFARRLIAAGVPEKQAETQAELMAEAFVYNVDSLVTKDYLDARFAEQDARLETHLIEQDTRTNSRFSSIELRFADIDRRFTAIDEKFIAIDKRFMAIDKQFDTINVRFDAIDAKFSGIEERFIGIDQKFAGMDVHFAEIKGRFKVQDWILGSIAACTVLPTLYSLFNP